MSTSLARSAKNEGKIVDPNFSQEDIKIVKKKTRRARKSNYKTVSYIPGTVIYDVLVRSPATFVYNCRLVNKEWRDLICRPDFIAQNFSYSEPQLLLQCPTSYLRTCFDIKVMKFDDNKRVCKLSTFDLPKMGLIKPSCHGLLLADIPNQLGVFRLLNPVTKKHITLPRYPPYCPYNTSTAALVFDPLTKVFKVVYMYNAGAGFGILTLLGGQETTWKRVFVKEWKGSVPDPIFMWRDPLVSENGRVLHWNVNSVKYILSMDISEEEPVVTLLPDLGLTMFTQWRYILLELEGRVAVVYYDSIALFCVWVLIDFRASLWEHTDSIRKEIINYEDGASEVCPPLKELALVGSMENGRYLVFKHDQTDDDDGGLYLYLYDMNKREMKNRYKINKKMKKMEDLFTYRSSLIDWNTFRDEQVNTD